MEFQIHPQEFHVLADRFEIRTRCPAEAITDAMIERRVRAANLHAGDRFKVLCMDHAYETVLHMTEYLVYSRNDEMTRQQPNDRDIKQVHETTFGIARISEWWNSPAAEQAQAAKPKVSWNPGQQAHQVIAPDGTVLNQFTKEDGGKEAALQYAQEAA